MIPARAAGAAGGRGAADRRPRETFDSSVDSDRLCGSGARPIREDRIWICWGLTQDPADSFCRVGVRPELTPIFEG